MRVFTTPGSDWLGDGHGFPIASTRYTYRSVIGSYNFGDLLDQIVSIQVWNLTLGVELNPITNYSINWQDLGISIASGVSENQVIAITAYGLGGGNQLYNSSYNGADVGNSVVVPVAINLINEIAVFVNSELVINYTYSVYETYQTRIVFADTYTSSDYIAVSVLGDTTPVAGRSWSTPQTQYFISAGELAYPLSNSLEGTNPANLIVEKNGVRARPSEGVEYIADGSSLDFDLPTKGGYQTSVPAGTIIVDSEADLPILAQSDIDTNKSYYTVDTGNLWVWTKFNPNPGPGIPPAFWAWVNNGAVGYALVSPTDVTVYINNTSLILGTEFFVNPWNGVTPRTITLATPPAPGSVVLISVRTAAQYFISGNFLIWKATGSLIPESGDIISVTTWNDTSEQDILTQVFVGPTTQGLQVVQPYDTTDYDIGLITGDPGSFDYSDGTVIQTNTFDTGREILDASRLEVSLDGIYLFEGVGYSVEGSVVTLSGPPINPDRVVAITSFTQTVVPGEIGFRIFQDMRGLQTTYRISRQATTQLAQPLLASDEIIYVVDAEAMPEPNLTLGIFGLVTIDGERISYRTRNLANNTLSGLRRGTAGTAAADHATDTAVYDIGRGEILPREDQNYVQSQDYLADGSTTVFTSDDIVLTGLTVDQENRAVEVYVGGQLQTTGYQVIDVAPVAVSFVTAPTANYQVTLLVRRGTSWYAPGSGTASNGIPLQEQQTRAARFIRGD
jgi:hypothetical protein